MVDESRKNNVSFSDLLNRGLGNFPFPVLVPVDPLLKGGGENGHFVRSFRLIDIGHAAVNLLDQIPGNQTGNVRWIVAGDT